MTCESSEEVVLLLSVLLSYRDPIAIFINLGKVSQETQLCKENYASLRLQTKSLPIYCEQFEKYSWGANSATMHTTQNDLYRFLNLLFISYLTLLYKSALYP